MKHIFTFILVLSSVTLSLAQKDIWYVWVDTQINKDGKDIRLVSEAPIKITCCVKSPKFKRFQKKAAKWIRSNYDAAFDGESPLRNIEDKSFAVTVIEEAEKKKESGQPILLVKYSATCR